VFPTGVGMNRSISHKSVNSICVPHRRGDGFVN
jgi:hypothetical protein